MFNDYRNTGEVSHAVGYSGPTRGGFIAYREYGLGKVWFDGYNFTGVGAEPTLAQPPRIATVFGGEANLTLPKRSRARATVYDQGGRLVRKLVNGTLESGRDRLELGVTGGVYFLRVAVDGRVETAKLVRLRQSGL